MAIFLLIDERGRNRDHPVVRVVDGKLYAKETDPAILDYITWSKVGDVLQLDPNLCLIRLGSYKSVPRLDGKG
jgi:hypothetical protein